MDDLPTIESAPAPYLPRDTVQRGFDNHASFDAGRGCPFQCSFCTIINVQARKSRRRSPDNIEQLIKKHWADGIRRFFITDDNFARNKDWEDVFDRIIRIREVDKIDVRLIIQVDTLCHKIPNFIEKSRRAGVTRVFIGLENINPTNLLAAKKRQNKITEYRKMLLSWKQAGIITAAAGGERHDHLAAAIGAVLLFELPSDREGAPAAGRRLPPEISPRSPARSSDRAGLVVLSRLRLRDRLQARAHRQELVRARPP